MADLSNDSDPTNRTITASVTDGVITSTVEVVVVGTTINLSGPNALSEGDVGRYTIVVEDSEDVGINGTTVDVTSAQGNTIDPVDGDLVTGVDGEVLIDLTADAAANDVLTVSALAITVRQDITVSDDIITIEIPKDGREIDLGDDQNIRVVLVKDGAPAANETVVLSTTRGTLDPIDGITTTDAQGIARRPGGGLPRISSSNAGPAVVTATNSGLTTTVSIEFVATVADTLVLQAEPATVLPLQQSEVVAVVRDPNGNLVKNQVVSFDLSDITTGSLSVAANTTDSQGRAETFYTASDTSSAQQGVTITATVVGTNPAISDSVDLTVGGQGLFLVIGTGNNIIDEDDITFQKEFAIFVTDSTGAAVAGKGVQVSLRSVAYWKGFLVLVDPDQDAWTRNDDVTRCLDEDVNLNGIPDIPPDFDDNNNGKIEAGNVASVAPVPPDAPAGDDCASAGATGTSASVTTNGIGLARVCMSYPQDHGTWVDVRIEAKAGMAGTEFSTSQQFTLPVKAQDYNDETTSPPGPTLPFGPDDECAIPPP